MSFTLRFFATHSFFLKLKNLEKELEMNYSTEQYDAALMVLQWASSPLAY